MHDWLNQRRLHASVGRLLICQLALALMISSAGLVYPDRSVTTESLKQDIIGTCTYALRNFGPADGNGFDRIDIPEDVDVGVLTPADEQLTNYLTKIPDTVTMVHPGLHVGNVKCRPTALTWMMNTQNNWQLPPSHPRNNKTICVVSSKQASEEPSRFYGKLKRAIDPYYMIHAKHAIIHESGILGLGCGYVQLHEGCETIFKFMGRKWHQKCKANITAGSKISWNSYFMGKRVSDWSDAQLRALSSCMAPRENLSDLKRFNRVFVVTAAWDGNYHHFISDSLSRLIPYYDFLQKNTDIVIHIRFSERYARKAHIRDASRTTRERLLTYLNISLSRIIFGTIVADQVFLPKATRCNEPMAHALELR
jgi:regulation of enolase protein 1 (concanavalin A-like superfamily)